MRRLIRSVVSFRSARSRRRCSLVPLKNPTTNTTTSATAPAPSSHDLREAVIRHPARRHGPSTFCRLSIERPSPTESWLSAWETPVRHALRSLAWLPDTNAPIADAVVSAFARSRSACRSVATARTRSRSARTLALCSSAVERVTVTERRSATASRVCRVSVSHGVLGRAAVGAQQHIAQPDRRQGDDADRGDDHRYRAIPAVPSEASSAAWYLRRGKAARVVAHGFGWLRPRPGHGRRAAAFRPPCATGSPRPSRAARGRPARPGAARCSPWPTPRPDPAATTSVWRSSWSLGGRT